MRVVIVGAGSLGSRAAALLVRRGCEVVVIEQDAEVAQSLGDSLDCGVIRGDGTRPAVLKEADPSHTDVLLSMAGNAQTNLIASLVARSLGIARVITRIDDEEFEHIAIELGLVDTIIPARTIGRYVADAVEGHDILDLSGAIKGDARVLLVVVREEDEGTVKELALPDATRVSHVYRDGQLLFADADFRLRRGDEMVIILHRRHLEKLRERWAPRPAADKA
jgi:trk/ktr system potassium uptake protein